MKAPWVIGVVLLALTSGLLAQKVSLSAGDIDIDVDVWKLGYYVVTTDPETGERRRLEDFEFSMEFTEVNCEGGPVYKLADYGHPEIRTYNKSYPGGVYSSVIEQKATLPDNAEFVLTIEQFGNETYKDFCGWKMPLSPTTVKMSTTISNLPFCRTYELHGLTNTTMIWRDNASIFEGTPDDYPVWSYHVYLQEKLDPEVSRPILYNSLTFRDKRFDLFLDFVANGTMCTAPDECVCAQTRHMQLVISDEELIQLLIQLERDPSKRKKIDIPFYVELWANYTPIIEWDPNLSVLFTSPSGLSTSGDKSNSGSSGVNAAVVGGIIAAVAVVAIAIAVVLVLRKRGVMRKSVKHVNAVLRKELGEAQEQETEKEPQATTPNNPEKSSWRKSQAANLSLKNVKASN